MGLLLTIGWLVVIVYATIPPFWLAIHPFTRFWRSWRKPLPLIGVVWAAMWVLAGLLTARWRHATLYATPLSWIPGVALLLAAWWTYAHAKRDFSTDQVIGRSELQPERHEQRLVTTGLRARVRHPLYLGHLLSMLGWTIGTGTAANYLLSAFAIVTGAWMIRTEEHELVARFGDEYRDYQRRVPAILPLPVDRRP